MQNKTQRKEAATVANIFGTWLNGIDNKLKTILRIGELAVIWSLWLCRNDKIFSDKISLVCRFFIDARVFYVRGPSYNGWISEAFSWRCVTTGSGDERYFYPSWMAA